MPCFNISMYLLICSRDPNLATAFISPGKIVELPIDWYPQVPERVVRQCYITLFNASEFLKTYQSIDNVPLFND